MLVLVLYYAENFNHNGLYGESNYGRITETQNCSSSEWRLEGRFRNRGCCRTPRSAAHFVRARAAPLQARHRVAWTPPAGASQIRAAAAHRAEGDFAHPGAHNRKTDRTAQSAGPIRQADRPWRHRPAGAPRVHSFVALATFYRPPYSSRFRLLASHSLVHVRVDRGSSRPTAPSETNASPQAPRRRAMLARRRER